ncbi:MAG: MFS transporter [Halobacteriales archaeon]
MSEDPSPVTGDSETPPASGSGASEYNVRLVVGSLIAGVFFGGVGGGVAFPTLPTLGTILGIAPVVVGFILSANRFTRLVMNTPAGQIIDTVGTRKPMIAGLALQGITPFGYIIGLSPDQIPILDAAGIFFTSRLLWGIGSAFVFTGAFGTVIHVTTERNRGKWIGYFRGGQSLGFPTGLILGGILTDLYGYSIAFGVAGLTGLFAALVAAVVLPDVTPDVSEPARIRELPSIIRADPRILMIGTVNLGVRFLFGGIILSTIVLYAEVHGINIGTLSAVGVSGALMAISVLASGATTVIAGNLSDRLSNRAFVVIPAMGALALGFAALAAVPMLATTVLGVALIGVGSGGTNPPLLAYLGDISPADDVGKMGGVYNVFGDIGSAIGPIVALPIAARIGYRAEYALCIGLVVVILVFVIRTLLGDPEPRVSQATLSDD